MKKSQVLAALALAFAMGLAVIPTASTFAESVNDADFGVITDENADSKLQDAITMGKNSCGWHLDGTDKIFYYDQYSNLDYQLTASAKAIAEREAQLYTYMAGEYAGFLSTFEGVLTSAGLKLPANVKATFPENVKTYSEAVKFVENTITALKDNAVLYRNNNNTSVYPAYQAVVNALSNGTYTVEVPGANEGDDPTTEVRKGLLKIVFIEQEIVEDAQAKILEEDNIAPILGEEPVEGISYDDAVKKANALRSTENGTCSVTKVQSLKKAINYAQNMLDSDDNFTVADVEKAIAAIKKAMNGGIVTDADLPEKPADTNNGSKAPDTGILSNEDGGASTTVAMVAGVATALTAAGAGVVAYRNARRSSRK